MIEYTSGNILQCEADALVNTVNCVGVMGRGIALQFKHAYPENFKAYAAACQRKAVQPGRMFVFDTGQLTPPRFIVNFPTKRHWRGKSRIEDIESGLADVQVFVFEPKGVPASDKMSHIREVPKMTEGRAALVELMQRYLGGLLDPFVTLLELHKLMYFMQEAGEPLRLNYVKHHYGPYAENLRHVLHAVEGHLIAGYADGGDAPDKPLSLVPGAVDEAKSYLDQHQISRARFERVTRLVEGFESPYGLELLATVHWVMSREGATQPDSVARLVYDWNPRKRQMTQRQIGIAMERLRTQGWVS